MESIKKCHFSLFMNIYGFIILQYLTQLFLSKRANSYNLNYMKHIVTHVIHGVCPVVKYRY